MFTSSYQQPLARMCLYSLLDLDSQTRHMALSSLFMEVLMMMNNATVPTAEFLRGSIRTWIGQKVHGLVVLPLLTAACQSLASVRHMAETTEACITAYFKEGKSVLLPSVGSQLIHLFQGRLGGSVVKKRLPMQEMQETQVRSWVEKFPWSRKWQLTPSILAWKSPRIEKPAGL